jgi:hypothetical protein
MVKYDKFNIARLSARRSLDPNDILRTRGECDEAIHFGPQHHIVAWFGRSRTRIERIPI